MSGRCLGDGAGRDRADCWRVVGTVAAFGWEDADRRLHSYEAD